MLALGPTGVGKTESMKVVAEFLFGPQKLFRFDCASLQSDDCVAQLLGNRSGDKGLLGEVIRTNESGMLLFDELEKANPKVLLVLLAILEPGIFRLLDGEWADARAFYVVCTGNIASADLANAVFSSSASLERHVLEEAKDVLKPEVLNRFDEILVYRAFDHATELKVAGQKVQAYIAALADRGYVVSVKDDVLRFLALHGFDRELGARPILRTVARHIGNAVADHLIRGGSGSGSLCVSPDRSHLVLH